MQQGRNDHRANNMILGSRYRGFYTHFEETIRLPSLNAYTNAVSRSFVQLIFLAVCLFVGMFISTRLFDVTVSVILWSSHLLFHSLYVSCLIVRWELAKSSITHSTEWVDLRIVLFLKCWIKEKKNSRKRNRSLNRWNWVKVTRSQKVSL